MKKRIFFRIMWLLALYCAVFIFLVAAQFTHRGSFSRRIGNMLVSGHYRVTGQGPADFNEQFLNGGASVVFGGLEFRLRTKEGEDGFSLVDSEGSRQAVLPERLSISGDAATFMLPGGTELSFITRNSGGAPELRISGIFVEGLSGLEIPFTPQRSSFVRITGDGNLNISYNGGRYQFNQSALGVDQGRLFLPASAPLVSYRAIPEQKIFNAGDYVVSQAQNSQLFGESLSRWKDQSFSWWSLNIAAYNDEDMVIAYSGEAVRRGNYRSAVASVSSAFRSGSNRTWESSVYLGGMNTAIRSLAAADREKMDRVSRLINEKSFDLLKEDRVFEFLAVRGFGDLVDGGLEFISSIEPANIGLDICPGIIEGYMDTIFWRPNRENPFEHLLDQACLIISEGIRQDQDRVLVFGNAGTETADIAFNFRLGKALWTWGEQAGHDDWAALGRSLILSVIALGDSSGAVPALVSGNGEANESAGRLSSAKLYRILDSGENAPRAKLAGSGAGGIWAWTAASEISAVQKNNVMDISVSFPIGETHYMMIRGIKPFSRIVLHETGWRSDPQFERYDSSGWIYSEREQILVLKLRHRVQVEHVLVDWEPIKPPPRPPVEESRPVSEQAPEPVIEQVP
ncbi:MAG: hypothetical protein LBD18_01385 [Treponema sp.]|jgi:hypothetical protein|nr:hypothetical protein [Treponema sp.]